MRISNWSSDVCSADLKGRHARLDRRHEVPHRRPASSGNDRRSFRGRDMKPVRRRTKIDFRSNTWKDNQMKKMLLACLATSSLVPSAFAQSTAIPDYYPEDYGEIVADRKSVV